MYPIINLDDINLSAPYFVYASSDNKSIKFTTDNTLHYTVSFIEDYNFPGFSYMKMIKENPHMMKKSV